MGSINSKKLVGLSAEATVDGAYIHQPMKVINMRMISQQVAGGLDPATVSLWGEFRDEDGQMIPRIGQPHPLWGDFIVESINASPFTNSNEQAQLMVHYRNMKYVNVRIGKTLYRENTVLDADGQLLKIYYDANSAADVDTTTKQLGTSTYCESPIYRPTKVLEFDFITKVNPFSRDYPSPLGCINHARWQGGEAKTWLCMADDAQVVYDPTSGTEKVAYWKRRMEFHWRGLKAPGRKWYQTWEEIIMWRDPHNPRWIPTNFDPGAGLAAGQNAGNGWRRVLYYPTADFSKLLVGNGGFLPDVPALAAN